MNDTLIDRMPPPERAGVIIPWFVPSQKPGEDRLEETFGLVTALGCELAFVRGVQIRKTTPRFLLSGGLLDTYAEQLAAEACTIAIVDGALTPIQQRNLETRLNIKVIDRTGLILEIFGLRARTKEGRLQVELARQLYERSRLVRTWTHLERQRGGSGFLSGPGESQLEADRRMLDDKVLRLKRDLDDVRRTRQVQRAGRAQSGKPVIALVGYTNAGKSTLFNRLSGANVLARDMPFATLDPTIRRMELPRLGESALIDTVGFITDLPTHLIDSFQATLEEAMLADLLVHVRDRSSPVDQDQRSDVERVLNRLEQETGLPLPPMIEAWNKADLLPEDMRETLALAARHAGDPAAVLISAVTGEGIDELLELIEEIFLRATVLLNVEILPAEGAARAWLHAQGEVVSEQAGESGALQLAVRLNAEKQGQFSATYPVIAARAVAI